MDMGLDGLRKLVMDLEAWHAAIYRATKSRTQLSNLTDLNWTELNWTVLLQKLFFLPKDYEKIFSKHIFYIKVEGVTAYIHFTK